MKTITFRIDESDLDRIDHLCEQQHRKRSNLIQKIIKEFLDNSQINYRQKR